MKVDPNINEQNLDSSKKKILSKMRLQRINHLTKMKGCEKWQAVDKDVLPKDYTTVRDFLMQHASEVASVKGIQMVDLKRIIQFELTFMPDSVTTIPRPFEWIDQHGTLYKFEMPLLATTGLTVENRFGLSLREVNKFMESMTAARPDGSYIRTQLKYVASDEDQLLREEAYLWQLIHNKEMLEKIGTITYHRPIPAQWESLFKIMKSEKLLQPWIDCSMNSAFWRFATASPLINSKCYKIQATPSLVVRDAPIEFERLREVPGSKTGLSKLL